GCPCLGAGGTEGQDPHHLAARQCCCLLSMADLDCEARVARVRFPFHLLGSITVPSLGLLVAGKLKPTRRRGRSSGFGGLEVCFPQTWTSGVRRIGGLLSVSLGFCVRLPGV